MISRISDLFPITAANAAKRIGAALRTIQEYAQQIFFNQEKHYSGEIVLLTSSNTINFTDTLDFTPVIGDVIQIIDIISSFKVEYEIRTYTVLTVGTDTITVDQTLVDKTFSAAHMFVLLLDDTFVDSLGEMMVFKQNRANMNLNLKSESASKYSYSTHSGNEMFSGYPLSIMSALDDKKCLPGNFNKQLIDTLTWRTV